MSTLDAILQDTLPRVRRLAQRLATPPDPTWDADDLFQEGVIGLLAAIARYDPTRNARLWTYAEFVVVCTMREAKRTRLDSVSRSLRTKARTIATAIAALEQQHGRVPDETEIVLALDLSQETYQKLRTAVAGTQSRWSLDYPASRGGMSDVSLYAFLIAPTPDPAAQVERADAQRQREEVMARAIGLLPANEAQVLRLRYWDELPLKTIGAQLGVTESRACQLHTAALARLRRWLTLDEDWPLVAAQQAQRRATQQAQAFARQGVLQTQGRAAYLRMWRAQRKEKTR